ncbi:MAG: nitrilase-related carbon-nitrogen hydrolase [Hyphomicrobiaceae bacterium]
MTKIVILGCLIKVPADMRTARDRDDHIDRISVILDRTLRRRRVDVIVLAELSSISYSRHCFSHSEIFAEDVKGPTYQALGPIAAKHRAFLLYGAPRVGCSGGLHISQFCIDKDRQPAGVFDKLQLAQ